jgi:hypothetical protein
MDVEILLVVSTHHGSGLNVAPAGICPLTNLVADSSAPRPIGESCANLKHGMSTDLGLESPDANDNPKA